MPRSRIPSQVKNLTEGKSPYSSSRQPGPCWPDTSPARTILPVSFKLGKDHWDKDRGRHVITIPYNVDAFGICIHKDTEISDDSLSDQPKDSVSGHDV